MIDRRVIMISAASVAPRHSLPPFRRGLIGEASEPIDLLGRPLRDLRISLTDRCNFRCGYCMPKERFGRQHRFMPSRDLLEFDDITRIARAAVNLGVRTLRLTGGEPLLRKGATELVTMLRSIDGPSGERVDIAMTTNGSLLRRHASALRHAGLDRLTVSLDAIDDDVFRALNDVDYGVAEVIAGLDTSLEAGFDLLKVNMVVRRGLNDHQIIPLARFIRDRYRGQVELRFIEYMDVGLSNGWRPTDVLSSRHIVEMLNRHWPLAPVAASKASATASRWRYLDGQGYIGTISSVSEPFCGDCVRARLGPDGRLYTCLFAGHGVDLRPYLTSAGTPDHVIAKALGSAISTTWSQRTDRYSELRGLVAGTPSDGRIEMHYIGG